MTRPPVSIRAPLPDDLKFIRNSWFESYRKGGRAPQVGFDLFKQGQGPLIDRILEDAFVTVAYATEIPDEIIGWVCADSGACIHYVYIKQAYRRRGIGLQLARLYEGKLWHTHETRAGTKLASRFGTRFNPYPLYQLKPSE